MTDFATRLKRQGTDYIIRSLMDVDFYKFTMGYFIFNEYKGTNVKFSLINRAKTVPLALMIDEQELRNQLDHVRSLRFRKTELCYLRGIGKNFSEEYLLFLSQLQLPEYELKFNEEQIELTFKGPWEQVTFWETIAMAIISELYYQNFEKRMSPVEVKVTYANATSKLYSKLKIISAQAPGAKIADFGLRRRHSFSWQQSAIEMAQDVLGNSFIGTSNTLLAFNQDLTPIGTNAHELFCTTVGMVPDDEKKKKQYLVIEKWGKLYGDDLRIFLPDTFGTQQFFDNMPDELAKDVAHNWRGMRQDSGSTDKEAIRYMQFLRHHGVDPKEKQIIFSDGLDYDEIVRLTNKFQGELKVSFGWGTALTNDFIGCDPENNLMFRPFSMVCKVTEVEGQPAVKLSNNPGKATGPKEEVEKYKKIFGVEGHINQRVIV